jgi:hypothetical protein
MSARIALVNDTSLWNPHFGCQLVGQTFREQFKRCGLELKVSLPLNFSLDDPRLSDVDLVVVNGEGSLHSGNHSHLLKLSTMYPAALVNTVYENNPSSHDLFLKNFQYISTRDAYSQKAMPISLDVDVNPDVIFTSSLLNSFPKHCFAFNSKHFGSSVKSLNPKSLMTKILRKFVKSALPPSDIGITDNVLNTTIGFSPKTGSPSTYLAKLCSYNRLCIGRFHAVIAALLLEIPFSAWPSNTKKIDFLMQDLGLDYLFHPTFELALRNCPSLFPSQVRPQILQYQEKINSMFDKLADLCN